MSVCVYVREREIVGMCVRVRVRVCEREIVREKDGEYNRVRDIESANSLQRKQLIYNTQLIHSHST